MLLNVNRKNLDVTTAHRYWPNFKELINILITFSLVTFAWIFFRAESITHAFDYISGIFNSSIINSPEKFPVNILILILVLIIVEWMQRKKQHGLEISDYKIPLLIRWLIYYAVVILIIVFNGEQQDFIYFQF